MQFGVDAHAIVGHVARARSGIQKRTGRGFDLIVDADVVHRSHVRANAHDIAGLLDWRMVGNGVNLVVIYVPARLNMAHNMHPAIRTCGQVNRP